MPFLGRNNFFLPEMLPELECAIMIAVSISDILIFWSTL